jgi:hypothetical protein
MEMICINKSYDKCCKILKKPHNVNMNQFNLGNFISRFVNNSLSNSGGGPISNAPANPNSGADVKFQATKAALAHNIIQKSASQSGVLNTFSPMMLSNLKMNNLASLERSLYVKDLMKLPKEMDEVLVLLQKNTAANAEMEELLTTNINMSKLAELIQTNGKEAMTKLIQAMAEASKQGITDLSQIKDAMKLINASVSVAGQDNSAQLLKSFMLLYLPWLPLQEGVDFDLEIESSGGEESESEMSITILISTRNYGNVKVMLILLAQNVIDIFIDSCEGFPKDELLLRINIESQKHSIQSSVVFEQKMKKQDEESPRQAKISMSNLKEVNPFLLLMANAVIRHTIELDNQAG